MYDDKLRLYKNHRKEKDSEIRELERDRAKLHKRKKNKKGKKAMLIRNSIERLNIVCGVLKASLK